MLPDWFIEEKKATHGKQNSVVRAKSNATKRATPSFVTLIWVGLIMNKWACFVGEAPHALSDGGNPCLQVLNDEGWCNTRHHHGYRRFFFHLLLQDARSLCSVCCYADFALG